MQPAERLGDEIDASLFEDDDGTMYFLWHSGKIARLKPDMSGLAEPYHWLKTTATDPDPKHHSGLCAGIFGTGSFDHVGYEGMFLFKRTAATISPAPNSSTAATVATSPTSKNILRPVRRTLRSHPARRPQHFLSGRERPMVVQLSSARPDSERPAILRVEFRPQDGRVRAPEVAGTLRVPSAQSPSPSGRGPG